MFGTRKLPMLCALVILTACGDPPAVETEVAAEQGAADDDDPAFERLDPRFDELIPPGAVLEELGEGLQWAEGPVWLPDEEALLVSDVVSNVVFRWKEGEGLTRYLEPSGYTGTEPFTGREPGSNGLALDGEGRLVLARHGDRQIVRREHDGSFTVLASHYQGRRLNSPNDLVFGPNGDLYFTDPPYGLPGTFDSPEKELDVNGVYRVTPEGEVHLLTAELNAPNGIAFSPDGGTLYVASTDPNQRVWMAYPVLEDGSIGEGRVFAEATGDGPGGADGLEVDVDGNLFATGPGGVHVMSPEGVRLGRILTGQPTANVAWGDDGSVLYIASNNKILRVRTGTQGFPGFQNL